MCSSFVAAGVEGVSVFDSSTLGVSSSTRLTGAVGSVVVLGSATGIATGVATSVDICVEKERKGQSEMNKGAVRGNETRRTAGLTV